MLSAEPSPAAMRSWNSTGVQKALAMPRRCSKQPSVMHCLRVMPQSCCHGFLEKHWRSESAGNAQALQQAVISNAVDACSESLYCCHGVLEEHWRLETAGNAHALQPTHSSTMHRSAFLITPVL